MRLVGLGVRRDYQRWVCPRCGVLLDYLLVQDLNWFEMWHDDESWCNTWLQARSTMHQKFVMHMRIIYEAENNGAARIKRAGLWAYQLASEVLFVHFGPGVEHVVAHCDRDGTACLLRQENPWASAS